MSRGNLRARVENILLWFLQFGLAVAFLGTGEAIWTSDSQMVAMFDFLGFAPWLRSLTGVLEISGALLLLMPRVPVLGAVLLLPILAGTIFTQLRLQDNGAFSAMILFVLVLIVAWRRWGVLREALCSIHPQIAPSNRE